MFGLPPEVIMGVVTGIASFFAKNSAMKRQDQKELIELALKVNAANDRYQNNAAKRSSPMLRKIVATMIIFVAFAGLLLVAYKENVPTSMLSTGDTKSFLWGLISWTTKPEIIEANGFFIADYIKYGVHMVCGFLFGGSLAKATK